MKLKAILEVGRTIAYYDNEANHEDLNSRALMMINAATEALADTDDMSKEAMMSWITSRFMDVSPKLHRVIEDMIDQDQDTTPAAGVGDDPWDPNNNEDTIHDRGYDPHGEADAQDDEFGDRFMEAHTPKDDAALNKRLQEVLKLVKKWKGPKKVKKA